MTQKPPLTPAHAAVGKLKSLRLRDTQDARRRHASYSRAVFALRWILPALVSGALALLWLWPHFDENAVSLTVVDNVPNLMVEKLNLTGLDAKNQRYALTADRALQAANSRHLIDLQNPKGEIATRGGGWLVGQAQEGRLDQKTRILRLGGHVEMFHDSGVRFSSPEVRVDLDKSMAWGEQPVVIQGDFGEIHGTGFRVNEAGKTVVVTGHATARLLLAPAKSAGQAPPPAGKK